MEFQWTVLHSENCTLSIDTLDVTGKSQIVMEVHNKTYNLIVRNGSGYAAQKPLAPSFTFIVSFQAAGNINSGQLTFQWKTRNCSFCEIGDATNLSASGQADRPVARTGRNTYMLKAYPVEGTGFEMSIIEFTAPQINKFNGVDYYTEDAIAGPKAELPLADGQPFVTLEELNGYPQIAVVDGVYGFSKHIVGVEWNVTNAVRCDLLGVRSGVSLPSGFIETGQHGTYTLRAISDIETIFTEVTMTF